MRKVYLITAILLLSTVWAVAQTTPSSPSTTQPATPDASSQSTSPATPSQSTTPDSSSTSQTTTTQTTTSTDTSSSIEGCLNGSVGSWTLTDTTGKTWQLAGDTSKLSDHVGHQVRITGSDTSAAGGSSSGSATPSSGTSGSGGTSGSQSTFTVKRVKMISSSCSTSSK